MHVAVIQNGIHLSCEMVQRALLEHRALADMKSRLEILFNDLGIFEWWV